MLSNRKSIPSSFMRAASRTGCADAQDLTLSVQTWVLFLFLLFIILSVLIERFSEICGVKSHCT
jgi:hypothetical protein